jgi:hypothetical protein
MLETVEMIQVPQFLFQNSWLIRPINHVFDDQVERVTPLVCAKVLDTNPHSTTKNHKSIFFIIQ